MKLLIDTLEEDFKWINNHLHTTDFQTTERLYESVRKGIPFDSVIEDIKEEIREKINEHVRYTDYGRREDGLFEALEIIDKHVEG